MAKSRLAIFAALNIACFAAYQLLILYQLGFSAAADVYFASVAVPGFINAVLFSLFTFALLPKLSKPDMAFYAAGILLLPIVVLCALIYLFAWWLLHLGASYLFFGFSSQQLGLFLTLLPYQSLAGGLLAVTLYLNVVAQARNAFSLVELTYIGSTLLVVLLLLLQTDSLTAQFVSQLDCIRAMVSLLALLVTLRLVPTFAPAKQLGMLRDCFRGASALLAGNCFLKSFAVVDKALLTGSAAGEISMLHILQYVNQAVNRVFSRVIAIPFVVRLASGDAGVRAARQRYRQASLVGLGGSLLVMAAAVILLLLFINYANWMPAWDRDLLLSIVLMASALLVCSNIGQISANYFYAEENVRLPMMVSVITGSLSLLLKIALVSEYGVVGILAGLSFHQLANWAILNSMAVRNMERLHVG